MGLFKMLGRGLIYPILRPMEQAKTSFDQIGADINDLRARRAQRMVQSEEELRTHLDRVQDPMWNGPVVSEEELLNPKLIKDPYMRFEVLFSARGWTDDALRVQLLASRRTKRTAAWTCVVLLLAGLLNIVFSPVWIVLLTSSLLLTGSAICFASSIKYAIWQSQLEKRKLLGFKELLSRPDLASYLFLK